MKVQLIQYNPEAVEILLLSKQTRRLSEPNAYESICSMPQQEKETELQHIFETISSPLEFIDYIFLITGVTRAFTHQLVRHRVGFSFAQQSLRMPLESHETGCLELGYLTPPGLEANQTYHDAMAVAFDSYERLVSEGVPPQDARGVLPTNVLTNILVKANLRALGEMMSTRLCVRTQGEFQRAAMALREEILKVHPWASEVLLPYCLKHHSCQFPKFNKCRIKKQLPQYFSPDDFRVKAQAIWSEQVGNDIQPE